MRAAKWLDRNQDSKGDMTVMATMISAVSDELAARI
jgi:hypothetical protein